MRPNVVGHFAPLVGKFTPTKKEVAMKLLVLVIGMMLASTCYAGDAFKRWDTRNSSSDKSITRDFDNDGIPNAVDTFDNDRYKSDYQKDYEIIPFHQDEAANQAEIADFMSKYITKPFSYLENVVGVELNFNKIFYKPEKLREVVDILTEIDALDGELKELEAGLAL